MRRLIRALSGLFAKVMSDIVAEAQSDHAIADDSHTRHIGARRSAVHAGVERNIANGESSLDTDVAPVTDAIRRYAS